MIDQILELSEQIDNIDDLILKKTKDLLLKKAELEKEKRALENELALEVFDKDYGQKTVKDGEYTITVARRASHKLDKKVWDDIKDEVSPELWPVSYEPKLSVAQFNELKQTDVETYKRVCKAVTMKVSENFEVKIKRGE
jgi:hypothetical protein